jgi:hypothetical protein
MYTASIDNKTMGNITQPPLKAKSRTESLISLGGSINPRAVLGSLNGKLSWSRIKRKLVLIKLFFKNAGFRIY